MIITKIHVVIIKKFVVVNNFNFKTNVNKNDIDIKKIINENKIIQRICDKYEFNKNNNFKIFIKFVKSKNVDEHSDVKLIIIVND